MDEDPQPLQSDDQRADRQTKKRSGWPRTFLRFGLIYILVPYMSIVSLLGMAQRALIYHPTRTSALRANQIHEPGATIEDVEIPIDDVVTLHGWHYQPRESGESDRKFFVIYFGGNGGCRAHRIGDCIDFTRLGCDVVLFDYRGYGDNKGSPTEANIASDAMRVWEFAREKLQFPSRRILIFGESLGGATATRLASELSDAKDPPAALILNSTFSSLVETAEWHYPFVPAWLLLIDRFPSIKRIPKVTCPILQFHGTADNIVPYEHGKRLFEAAPKQSANGIEKQFITIEGGNHNEIGVNDMDAAVKKLLDRIE